VLVVFAIFSYALIFALLLALAYRDLKEYILPDYLNAALGLSFISFHIATHWNIIMPIEALTGAIIGGGFLFLVRIIAHKFYKENSLGLGDVKLITVAGFGLGTPEILMALSLGAFAGLIHGLCMACADRKNKNKISFGQINVPAGLGLAVGIALVTVYKFGFEWLTIK
jgi:leader peptidase (prepilin peptidase)/N-methyltransferase